MGLSVEVGDRVRWSLISVNTDSSVSSASVEWKGNPVSDETGNFKHTVTLSCPGLAAVDMVPRETGQWLLGSPYDDMKAAGMIGLYTVLPASTSGEEVSSLGRGTLYAILVAIIVVSVAGVAIMSFYMIKSALDMPLLRGDLSPILIDSTHHSSSEVLAKSSSSNDKGRSVEM